jgi:hypothetical protein
MNLAWLAVLVSFIAERGMPGSHERDFWLFVMVAVTPIPSIVALAWKPSAEAGSWLSLWIKRKTAEERVRIREIEQREKAALPPYDET